MADTFQDGIEAAARLMEAEGGLFGRDLAAKIRALQCGDAVPVTDLEEAFRQFKRAYLSAGGFRNPKTEGAKGWDAAEAKFKQLVTKKKHSATAIVMGTQAFAASRPQPQYVRAPDVFLNKEEFCFDYSRAQPNGTKNGVRTLFDTARDLSAH